VRSRGECRFVEKMAITDSFVLPDGFVLQAVSELPEMLRRELASRDGDFILSRPTSRARAKVIEPGAAEVVREFNEPSTIARAVARCSRRTGLSAQRLLEDALPMLLSLIGSGLLVPAGSQEALPIQPSLVGEKSVGEWKVLRCAQALEDTEIYQVRDATGRFGALKIGRVGVEMVRGTMEQEARILSDLDSSVTPKLFETGQWRSRPYLIVEWFAGTDIQRVCGELRRRNDEGSSRALLQVTLTLLEAYAHLHERGIVHGDVHPRNILVDRNQQLRVVDFGLAHRITETPPTSAVQRGGIGFFYEPELARATLNNAILPPPTTSGEQYSLAALLYLLITGLYYVDFSLEKNAMLHQIAQAPMLPFTNRGLSAWPDVERLLERAFSKEPFDRFSSVAELAELWSAAVPRAEAQATSVNGPGLAEARTAMLKMCEIGGPLSHGTMPSPSASVNYGSAGVAYALCRIACATDDPKSLGLSDVWSDKSVDEIGIEGAFYDTDLDITPETVGRASLYHGPAGVFLVQALIAQARGDRPLQHTATQAFIEASRHPTEFLDLTLGRAGALLGCTFLFDAFDASKTRSKLKRLGNDICNELWEALRSYPSIGEPSVLTLLGIAHGWAGLLYSTMCWCAAAGQPLPDSLTTRLQELADCAEPAGRGLQWKWDAARLARKPYMPGWCNGSAGYVFLWTQAFELTGERRHLDLAEGAAWHTWEMPTPNASLCCGKAGQAYALLNFYRHCGDLIWLRRAVDLAQSAARGSRQFRDVKAVRQSEWRPQSLYKGEMGVAVLAADLETPEDSRMPLFERDP
jgi:serine/threonine protein kinase